jgi:hypothetical protein
MDLNTIENIKFYLRIIGVLLIIVSSIVSWGKAMNDDDVGKEDIAYDTFIF